MDSGDGSSGYDPGTDLLPESRSGRGDERVDSVPRYGVQREIRSRRPDVWDHQLLPEGFPHWRGTRGHRGPACSVERVGKVGGAG